jgi:hypothetical protein
MNNFEQFNEIPRYKKKSTAQTPKKSKHKHLSAPCVISYPSDWYTKEHLRNNERQIVIGAYCPICGKIRDLNDKSQWYKKETVFFGICQFTETALTAEGEKEMNESTRTLPYFEIDSPFDKFVALHADVKQNRNSENGF